MTPLDEENLAHEQNLIHASATFRVADIDRPSPPDGPCGAPRDLCKRTLWSSVRYSFDTIGQERACVTHCDGHSIMWTVLDPSDAFLIAPAGAVIRTPAAYAEAQRYATYWGAP